MKKLFAVLLTLCMVLGLAACGDSGPADPNCGTYKAESAEAYGVTMSAADVFDGDFTIELQNGGKAILRYAGKTQRMKWTLDGTSFHAKGGGDEIDGTLSNGVLVIEDMAGTGIKVTLVNPDFAPTGIQLPTLTDVLTTPEPTAEAPVSSPYSWWEGKWYGWGCYYTADGAYAEYQDSAWDAVAEITVNGDTGAMKLWDIDKMETPEVEANVRFEAGITDAGKMVCVSGTFMEDVIEFEDGEWEVNPGTYDEEEIEHTILLTFVYSGEEGSIRVVYILRPWGMLWDDMRDADTSNMIYDDMMPICYEDWYLPQLGIEPGQSGAEPAGEPGDVSALVGQWAHASGYTYTFNADGTGNYGKDGAVMEFTFTVSGDQLSILYTTSTTPFTTTFRIHDNILTILDSFGNEVDYPKV